MRILIESNNEIVQSEIIKDQFMFVLKQYPSVFTRVGQKLQDRLRFLLESLCKKLGLPKVPGKDEASVSAEFKRALGYDGESFLQLQAPSFSRGCIFHLADDNGLVHSDDDGIRLLNILGIKVQGSVFSVFAYLVLRFRLEVAQEINMKPVVLLKNII